MSDYSRLIRALRALEYHINEVHSADYVDAETCAEAADAINALKAERDALKAENQRLREVSNQQVKVKPLVWEGDGHWSIGPDEGWMEEANTPFGWGYSVEFGRDGNFMIDSTFDRSQDGFDTPDDAKAAAQADYERRIRAALAEQGEG